MLSAAAPVRVFLACGTTDLRKSFDTLSGVVRQSLELDPQSGDLFVFCSRSKRTIKILHWDGTGFWVMAKRLAKGTFAWPCAEDSRSTVDLRADELDELLGGIDLQRAAWRRWCRPPPPSLPRPPLAG